MKKRIITYGLLFVLLIITLPVVLSYFFPGKVRPIDMIRLPLQSRIMATASRYTIDELNPLIVAPVFADALSYSELQPYLSILQPGDILFTNSDKYLSSLFIPGKFKHALIYLGNKEQLAALLSTSGEFPAEFLASIESEHNHLILDSNEDGVEIRPIRELYNLQTVSTLESIIGFRYTGNPETIREIILFATKHLGKAYDFDLDLTSDQAIYCSELVYKSLLHAGIGISGTEWVAGREMITPEALVRYMEQQCRAKGEFSWLFHITKSDHVISEHAFWDDHLR